jgi:hypothetical protein
MKRLLISLIILAAIFISSCSTTASIEGGKSSPDTSPEVTFETSALTEISPQPTVTQQSEVIPDFPSGPSTKQDKGKVIEFEDSFFKKLMLEALRFNAQLNNEEDQINEIYEEDLKGIYSLELGTGVNFLIELYSFKIIFNKKINGEDIKFHENVWCDDKNYFNYDFITTLSDLQYFPELKKLTLDAVMADDLSTVYQLSNLEELNISSLFNVKDISGISQLKNIKKLDIGGWSFDDKTEMYNIGYEQAELADRLTKHNIADCKYDVSFLSDMPQLEWLGIGGVNLDLSYLSNLSKLKILTVTDNIGAATDLSYLENMKNLQFLGLYFISNISNAESLIRLPSLKYLNYLNTNIDEKIIAKLNVRTDVGYVDINSRAEKYID